MFAYIYIYTVDILFGTLLVEQRCNCFGLCKTISHIIMLIFWYSYILTTNYCPNMQWEQLYLCTHNYSV